MLINAKINLLIQNMFFQVNLAIVVIDINNYEEQ